MNSRIYFDYLDSLRFFAFLAVFIAHAGILFPVSSDWFYGLYRLVISHGAYGVNFFFVLSGFLITYLLLKEKQDTSRIDIPFFYIKRVLRIWPVYFVVFFISIVVLPFFVRLLGAEHIAGSSHAFVNMNMTTQPISAGLFAFFFGNFSLAYSLSAIPFALGVLWSVSVEEQFYIVWPLIVKYTRKKTLFYASILIFFLSLIYRALHINDANIAYYSTFAVAMDLTSGALLGILYATYHRTVERFTIADVGRISVHAIKSFFITEYKKLSTISKPTNRKKRLHIKRRNNTYLFVLSLLCIVLFVYNCMVLISEGSGLLYDFLRLMKRPVLNAFFVSIVMYAVYRGIQKRERTEHMELGLISTSEPIGFTNKPFTYLGRISYGLYAYHTIVIVILLAIATSIGIGPNSVTVPVFIVIFMLSLMGTVYCSHISYHYMEKRVLGLRSRFEKK